MTGVPELGYIELTPKNKKGANMKILLVYPQYPDTFWSFKML
jgi:hypothetical protein